MNFKEFLRKIEEGGFINDKRAEDGKSKVKNPPVIGPKSIKSWGIGGGPGGYQGGGGISPNAATPAPAAPPVK